MTTMKGVVLTDIHQHSAAAQNIFDLEKPDFILDCGDHEDMGSLAGLTPHFYVLGNHEPRIIRTRVGEGILPTCINPGQVLELMSSESGPRLRVAGIGGNYSTKPHITDTEYGAFVDRKALTALQLIRPEEIDVLLLHESPLNNLGKGKDLEALADEVTREIDRIRPQYVFAGHRGTYGRDFTPGNKIPIYTLDDAAQGYMVLTVSQDSLVDVKRRIFHQARIGKS